MTPTGWRPRSVPEQLGLLGLGCAGAAVVWPAVSQATGASLICPLRTLTGVPCPLCGMTTAAVALTRGDLAASLAANPFLLLLAAATAVMAAVMAGRAAGLVAPPRPLSGAWQRRATLAAAGLALASWVVQLNRFGWL